MVDNQSLEFKKLLFLHTDAHTSEILHITIHSVKVQKNCPRDSFQNLTQNCTDEDGHSKLNFSNKSENTKGKNLPVYNQVKSNKGIVLKQQESKTIASYNHQTHAQSFTFKPND